MAVSLHSAFLSNEENSLYTKSRINSDERFLQRGVDPYNGVVMVRLWSNNRRSTYIQLLRTYRISCGLESRYSNILSNGGAKVFSPFSIDTVLKEKERFSLQATITLIARRQWSQFVAVALVLACTFLIIPMADAVDALKTCSCLLKECRLELAKCIANPSCAANVACLQTCNNRPDETEYQVFRSIDSGFVKGFPKDVKLAEAQNLECAKSLVIDRSIQKAYIQAIRSGQHFIYIENQYFLGSSYAWPSHRNELIILSQWSWH